MGNEVEGEFKPGILPAEARVCRDWRIGISREYQNTHWHVIMDSNI